MPRWRHSSSPICCGSRRQRLPFCILSLQPERTPYLTLHQKLHRRIAQGTHCAPLCEAIEKTHALSTIWIGIMRKPSTSDSPTRHQDLVEALQSGVLDGAVLDVFTPEPLPADSPLCGMTNVLITPHVATPPEAERRHFAARVKENVRRLAAGEELEGLIDAEGGY